MAAWSKDNPHTESPCSSVHGLSSARMRSNGLHLETAIGATLWDPAAAQIRLEPCTVYGINIERAKSFSEKEINQAKLEAAEEANRKAEEQRVEMERQLEERKREAAERKARQDEEDRMRKVAEEKARLETERILQEKEEQLRLESQRAAEEEEQKRAEAEEAERKAEEERQQRAMQLKQDSKKTVSKDVSKDYTAECASLQRKSSMLHSKLETSLLTSIPYKGWMEKQGGGISGGFFGFSSMAFKSRFFFLEASGRLSYYTDENMAPTH
ncbi:hypothetical protein CYMTET_6248 [Cymbomonas tetramitiformis]|uniref:PH domain-containing protein n=1 Tax=Cymbomonas tetramitiformis TaxID=36881 RepID=A0AAE0GXH7_9CHLO|nr:hypothetical protein CYMTET_6248 [Cymbomonas tetramitiformis]